MNALLFFYDSPPFPLRIFNFLRTVSEKHIPPKKKPNSMFTELNSRYRRALAALGVVLRKLNLRFRTDGLLDGEVHVSTRLMETYTLENAVMSICVDEARHLAEFAKLTVVWEEDKNALGRVLDMCTVRLTDVIHLMPWKQQEQMLRYVPAAICELREAMLKGEEHPFLVGNYDLILPPIPLELEPMKHAVSRVLKTFNTFPKSRLEFYQAVYFIDDDTDAVLRHVHQCVFA